MLLSGKRPGGVPQADAFLSLAEHGFVGDSIVDGPGLRCVIFCQGCPHGCPGCHNPATHSFTGGVPVGVGKLYARIRRHPLCRGVTFSGGEPFCQAAALAALAERLKEAGYELAAYTGYTWEYLVQQGSEDQKHLLACLDTLIDGPFQLAEKDLSLWFRGSGNQRLIDVKRSLAAGRAVLETAGRWVGEKDKE